MWRYVEILENRAQASASHVLFRGSARPKARELYEQAWKELVGLHCEQLSDRLAVEGAGDAITLKIGERVAGVLERGDGRGEETSGWFLWFADRAGEVDTDRGPEWVCAADAPGEDPIAAAGSVLVHDLTSDLAKGFTPQALATP